MMLTTVVERKHSTLNLLAADSWLRIIADYANLRNLSGFTPLRPAGNCPCADYLHPSVDCYHASVLMKR
jgi:hypothetical protein